jgi:hypothetical protein
VIKIKALLVAAAVSGGLALAMPATSQAMPVSAPIRMNTVPDGNIVQAHHHHKHKHWRRWREARRWHHYRWARYCDPWEGCYRHHRRFYSDWDEPYYGYYGYPYEPYYGPGFYGPGIGFQFRIY